MFKRCLIYIISFLGPYFLIKKFFPEEKLNNDAKNDLRGGGEIRITFWNRLFSSIKKDYAIKTAIGSCFIAVIFTEFNDNIASVLIKCSPSILAAPGDIRKNLFFSKKVKNILQSPDINELKELLLNQNLTNEDKLKLFMLKVKACLKNLTGGKRVAFLFCILSLIFFLVGNYTPFYTMLIASLRQLFQEIPLTDYIDEYVIELYREFNAPLPEHLMSKVKDKF